MLMIAFTASLNMYGIRKKAEEILKLKNDKFECTMNSESACIWVTDIKIYIKATLHYTESPNCYFICNFLSFSGSAQ